PRLYVFPVNVRPLFYIKGLAVMRHVGGSGVTSGATVPPNGLRKAQLVAPRPRDHGRSLVVLVACDEGGPSARHSPLVLYLVSQGAQVATGRNGAHHGALDLVHILLGQRLYERN